MTAPSSDRAGIRQIIRALRDKGYSLVEVWDGEETVKVRTESEAIDAVMAVDDATLFFRTPDGRYNPWVRFVLGNDPEEVVCDHVVDCGDFEQIIDSVCDAWWS